MSDFESPNEVEADLQRRFDIRAHAEKARQRGQHNALQTLNHLWQWHVTDAPTIGEILRFSVASASRVLARLERAKLICRVPTSGIPVQVFCLTPEGAAQVAPFVSQYSHYDSPPIVHPSRLPSGRLQHDLLAARFACGLRDNWHHYEDWKTFLGQAFSRAQYGHDENNNLEEFIPKLISATQLQAQKEWASGKVPDALLELFHPGAPSANLRIAIECQQSYESDTMVQVALSRYCQMLQEGKVHVLLYYGTRSKVLDRYREFFNDSLRPWSMTRQGRWIEEREMPTPYKDWMADRVMQIPLPMLEGSYYFIRPLLT